MINILKLILLASGMAGLLLYPMGNLIIILPSPLLYPLNYLQYLGIDGNFALGFLISAIILYCLSVPLRYSWNIGFIFLLIGFLGFIGLQIYGFDVSKYSLKQVLEGGFNFKYFVEFIIFLFNFIGLFIIYKSNLPEIIQQDEEV